MTADPRTPAPNLGGYANIRFTASLAAAAKRAAAPTATREKE
jgi:hypothetical protein